MEGKVSLTRILDKLKTHVILFCIIILGAFLLTFVMNNYVKETVYVSSTQILLNTASVESGLTQSEGLKTNIQLINTVSPIIKSRRIVSQVKAELRLTESVETLQQNMELTSGENSLVFTIKIKNTDPAKAMAIANEMAKVVAKDIPTLFDNTKVTILEEASGSTELSENKTYIITGLTSIIICLIILFCSVFFDTMIRSKRQIESIGLVYLGDIPAASILDEGDGRHGIKV